MGHAALGLANPAPQACLNFVPSRPRAWQLSGRRGWPAAPQVKFNAAQAVCSPAPPLPLVPCVQMRPHPAAPREPLGRVERGGPSSLLALAPRAQACSRQRPGPTGAGPAVPQALSRYRGGRLPAVRAQPRARSHGPAVCASASRDKAKAPLPGAVLGTHWAPRLPVARASGAASRKSRLCLALPLLPRRLP